MVSVGLCNVLLQCIWGFFKMNMCLHYILAVNSMCINLNCLTRLQFSSWWSMLKFRLQVARKTMTILCKTQKYARNLIKCCRLKDHSLLDYKRTDSFMRKSIEIIICLYFLYFPFSLIKIYFFCPHHQSDPEVLTLSMYFLHHFHSPISLHI